MATLRKPMISAAAAPSVQISQIRSYLYQLVDDLEFAFTSGMASDSVRTEADIQSIAAAVRTLLKLGNDKIADFVSDLNSDGIWRYRKWSSGAAECFGTLEVEVTEWSLSGGLYTYAAETNLPVGLFLESSAPIISLTVTGENGVILPYNINLTYDETAGFLISFGLYAPPTVAEDSSIVPPFAPVKVKINISVHGIWKQGV